MVDKIVFLGCAMAFGVSLTFPVTPDYKPAVIVKEVRPLMQWDCSKREFEEHLRVCRARKRSL